MSKEKLELLEPGDLVQLMWGEQIAMIVECYVEDFSFTAHTLHWVKVLRDDGLIDDYLRWKVRKL